METHPLARGDHARELRAHEYKDMPTIPDGELTPDEKQALVKHWHERGEPTLIMGRTQWFNVEAMLNSRDPYAVQDCRDHAAALRQTLARWNNDHKEVADETKPAEVRPRQPAL